MHTQIFVTVQHLARHQATHTGFAAGAEHPEGRVWHLCIEHVALTGQGLSVQVAQSRSQATARRAARYLMLIRHCTPHEVRSHSARSPRRLTGGSQLHASVSSGFVLALQLVARCSGRAFASVARHRTSGSIVCGSPGGMLASAGGPDFSRDSLLLNPRVPRLLDLCL